jgi:hypothetical protein
LLPKAFEQPAESQKYSELENVTTFGVAARKARDNDPAVHTNQDMFSCGSLSARFSTERLVRSDGCNDFGFARWVWMVELAWGYHRNLAVKFLFEGTALV